MKFGLVNHATTVLNPRGKFYSPGHSMIGLLQLWLVHPNNIRESAGLWAIPRRVFSAGECYPTFEQDLSTLGFKAGQYKLIVEFQSVEGRVLESTQTSFTVK